MDGKDKTRDPSPEDGITTCQVPAFVNIVDISNAEDLQRSFVVSNEATGRYFEANETTVRFLDELRTTGSIAKSAARAGILPQHSKTLVTQLIKHGVVTQPGSTLSDPNGPSAPVESKLVSIRWDLLDVRRLADRLSSVGRFTYSRLGVATWAVFVFVMVFELLGNREKVQLTLLQIFDAGLGQWAIFIALFIGMKLVHEMGHVLAYRQMCLAENHDPGPIRTGICIFALTPFPFTDVTGAWRLRARWRRIVIGAGGIYFETWIMAMFTIFWAHTTTGVFQTVSLQLAVISGALALLFNLNPAVKLDGYFILTDFLRRPNLAARASMAARTVFARWMGADIARQNTADMIYWCLSYAYRWTIFLGIFWIAYQFDKRLAPIVLILVVLTLMVRPIIGTVRFASERGAKTMHYGVLAIGTGGVALLCAVPFSYWQTVPGQIVLYESRVLEPNEAGRLSSTEDGSYELVNAELDNQILDLTYRLEILNNLKRLNFSSAEELARLDAEIALFEDSQDQLLARKASLSISADGEAIWTQFDAKFLSGSWVTPSGQHQLAALSEGTAARVDLRLNQSALDSTLELSRGSRISARFKHQPDCFFEADLDVGDGTLLAIDGVLTMRAELVKPIPTCAKSAPHGAAIVAKLDGAPKSVFNRVSRYVARLLQNRLPVETLQTTN